VVWLSWLDVAATKQSDDQAGCLIAYQRSTEKPPSGGFSCSAATPSEVCTTASPRQKFCEEFASAVSTITTCSACQRKTSQANMNLARCLWREDSRTRGGRVQDRPTRPNRHQLCGNPIVKMSCSATSLHPRALEQDLAALDATTWVLPGESIDRYQFDASGRYQPRYSANICHRMAACG
jgi:hypothetical protein